MKVSPTILVVLTALLSACASDTSSPLFRKVRAVDADGKLSEPLPEMALTPFQQLLRSRLPGQPPQPGEIFALEVDVPEGEGTEGNYLALVRTAGAEGTAGGGWELQYFEQNEHRPRADRAFHRMLTAQEAGEFEAFLKAHPLTQIRVGRVKSNGVASGDAVVAATQAGTQGDDNPPKGGTPNSEPPKGGTTNDGGTTSEEALVEGVRVLFRLTDARVDEAETVLVDSPRKGDHPVVDLLAMLKRFRDEGTLAASYYQTMPTTAKSMYADPYRRVLAVWERGGDLRIAVSEAVRPMEGAEEGAGETWLAYKDGRWVASEVPPAGAEVTTQPTTRKENEPPKGGTPNGGIGAVVPVDVTVVAVEPVVRGGEDPSKGGTPSTKTGDPLSGIAWEQMRRPDPTTWPSAERLVAQAREALGVPGIFLEQETWWTVPERNATLVYHYVPLNEKAGLKFGFVVPAFEFSDGQFTVDGEKGVMYLIHDGQLFSLPVPESALGKEAVRRAKGE
jgi:hypothetical protein